MMTCNATVETTFEDGSPETLRDDYMQCWRVAMDGLDGTLAVEKIALAPCVPSHRPIAERSAYGCAVARWHHDGTLGIYPVRHYGDNSTPHAIYMIGSETWIATRSGWEPLE